jgi:hypothetical protein
MAVRSPVYAARAKVSRRRARARFGLKRAGAVVHDLSLPICRIGRLHTACIRPRSHLCEPLCGPLLSCAPCAAPNETLFASPGQTLGASGVAPRV